MPGRAIPLVTGQFYHVYNRGVNKKPFFLGVYDFKRAVELLHFYTFAKPHLRYSKYALLSHERKQGFWNEMRAGPKLVDIITFCLMPNHFHFLLEQKIENGISLFMSNFQNSYTRYANTKYGGIGPLLQGQFKAVYIEDDNQLLHVHRYIHLNPYTAYIVKDIANLNSYQWSSLSEYLREIKMGVCSKEVIFSHFTSILSYQSFIFDQASYQRELDRIKHLLLE